MAVFPLPHAAVATLFRAVAVLGLVAALLGGVAGWLLLSRTGDALQASLELTSDTLESLDASAGVAQDTVAALAASLVTLEATAADLDGAFDDGERLMTDLGEVVRTDVASSIRAVEDSLPGLVEVAGTVDTTLGALSDLPIGLSYDPEQSFAAGLGELEASIDGLPERLEEQADLIEQTAGSLTDVGDGVGRLAAELASFDATLTQTGELLGTYDETIQQGTSLVDQATADLGRQLALSRVALVVFVLAFAGLQAVPLQLAAVRRTASGAADGPAA
ncbi:hypothetical protein [Euzebya tangerina]|uniref:hypothetical protein n=1 Tax=Euzebya tangerina TaxID=591198 RepID=UPI000E31427F|nr:hypothetical protein [Euzebya tangerina]